MFKNFIKVFSILLLAGFSFYYTERVTKIVREKDPIMIKINEAKESNYVSNINPIIDGDEYVTGIKGCEIDIEKSYDRMKTYGEYKNELLVMKEIENINDLSNKYITGGNKLERKVSIIFFIRDNINNDLIKYLNEKKIHSNIFIEHDYLENNSAVIKFLSEYNNIYYLGKNGKYESKYLTYISNLIGIYSKNESNYCLVNDKNDDTLSICREYNMKTIKVSPIKDNILTTIKNNLSNGSIITIANDNIENIKVAVNYILSKGYEIVKLDTLLNEKNKCSK